MKGFVVLEDLEVYQLSRNLSKLAWKIYDGFDWHDKKIMGDQFLTSIDSVGANIAEGYRRYHFLDKLKFYYISRASLSESCDHWLELMFERKKISEEIYREIREIKGVLEIKLSNFIQVTQRNAKQ